LFKTPGYLFFRVSACALLLWFASGGFALAASKPEIIVTGGIKSLRDNVNHFLPFAEEGCDARRWRLRSLLRDSRTQIMRAGQALGFYHLDFESDIEMTEDCWKLTITLAPGEAVRVTELRIVINGDGIEDGVFQAIHNNPGIKVGDRLNHGRYEALKARFSNLAAARGYFDGAFDLAKVGVNLKENSARIELVYNTGPRYHFGEITIEQEILDNDFVRRYLNIEEGRPYNTEELLKLKNRYNASNYFAMATISPDLQTLQEQQVPIHIQLDARKRRSYSMGAGVATDTGPRLLLGYEDRYINRRGHSLTAAANLSNVRSEVETAYTIPMKRPANEFLRFKTGFKYAEAGDTESELYTIGSSYTIYDEDQWLQIYGINYEMEDYIVGNAEEVRSHLIIPSVQYSRSKSDGSLYPQNGWQLMGRLSGSPESLGSRISFIQIHGRAKYIRPFLSGRVLLRVEGGATQIDESDELPASLRFFAGGDASVRGYSYESIGTEVDGKVIGGQNSLVGSIEYDYLIRPKWAIAAFYDLGDAAEDYNFNFRRSVGLGVRWISPIGPVRVDIACALDDTPCSTSSGAGWGLHLSMGPDL
jgi:translocation and assembly module TamA